jgi:hypothetical protein
MTTTNLEFAGAGLFDTRESSRSLAEGIRDALHVAVILH